MLYASCYPRGKIGYGYPEDILSLQAKCCRLVVVWLGCLVVDIWLFLNVDLTGFRWGD